MHSKSRTNTCRTRAFAEATWWEIMGFLVILSPP
jgi:hypothetical protein